MDRLLNLKHYSREIFPKHFLVGVHCEIEFVGDEYPVLSGKEVQLGSDFKEIGFEVKRHKISTQFTIKNEQTQKIEEISQESSPVGFVFLSQDPQRTVEITGTKLIFSDLGYHGFDNFLQNLKSYLEIIKKYLKDRPIAKIGFRKINNIKISQTSSEIDACRIFNSSIFGVLRSGIGTVGSLKVSHETLVFEREEKRCILNFSLESFGSGILGATLDFDLIDQRKIEIGEKDKLTTFLTELNDTHFDIFRWAITEDLLRILKVGKEEVKQDERSRAN